MKYRHKFFTFLVSALLVSLFLTCTPYRFVESKHDILSVPLGEITLAGIVHDPITIGNDSQFSTKATEELWPGDGSMSSPFVIEGYDIDRGGASGNCITIENTTVYFIIRDCYLEGATQTTYAGIRLWNLTNGAIRNNRFFNNYYGIYGIANHSIISNNVINMSTSVSIQMTQTYHTQIIGNEMIDTGYGLRLSSGAFNEIRNNIIEVQGGFAIRISTSYNLTIYGNQCSGATLNGVELTVCDNIVLEDNQFFENYRGLYLDSSTNTRILSTTIRANDDGLYLYDSYDTLVMYCNISDNIDLGIIEAMGSSGNVFTWNEFYNNSGHIQDESLVSSVYDFNYYDDYSGSDLNGDGFGEEPYIIPLQGDMDTHPLVYRPTDVVWSHTLTDQILELGEGLIYDLNVTSTAPIYDWTISDNQYFVVDNEGIVTDKGNLDVGFYYLEITAINIYGFSAEGNFSVTVEDSTNPVWITEVRNKIYNYGNWIEFQIAVWDDAGIEEWTISDNENFTLIEEAYGETGIATIINTHILDPGDYPVMLEAFDSNGNSVSMSFTVSVNTGGIGPGIGTDFGFIISLAGIGIAVLALLFGVCAFLNTRKKPSK